MSIFDDLRAEYGQAGDPGAKPAAAPSGDIPSLIARVAAEEGVGDYAPLLVGLAQRESSLNPRAQNSKSSAGGLFQFIDDTARRYGISDKYDAEQNARAAARMFRDHLEQFGGDADLALAAHHVGAGKAREALQNRGIGDVDVSTQDWLADVKRYAGMPAGEGWNGAPQYSLERDRLLTGTYDTLQQRDRQEVSDASPMATNMARGWEQMSNSLGNYFSLLEGDDAAIVERLQAWQKYDAENPMPTATAKFYEDWTDENYLTALVNVEGFAGGMVEQLSNSLPSMIGSIPGMIAGGAAGAAAGPIGVLLGATAGGALGSAPGSVALETGARIAAMAGKDGIDVSNPAAFQAWLTENRDAILAEGMSKGLTVAALDGVAGGVGSAIIARPALRLQQAERRILDRMGVNSGDEFAVAAARRTPEYQTAIKPFRAEFEVANTAGANAMRGFASFVSETAGEVGGEYFGEVAATGEGNLNEALLEGVMGGGQSAITAGAQFAAEKVMRPNSPLTNAANLAAGSAPPAAPGAPAGAAGQGATADPTARLAELEAITNGTPAQTVMGPNGQPMTIPGAQPRLFTQQEQDEYRALKAQMGGTSPAADQQGAASDPLAQRVSAVASIVEDKALISSLRSDPRFGKESVTDLLAAYAKARNPNLDPLIRTQALDSIDAFMRTFENRPNFTMGGAQEDQGGQQAAGTPELFSTPTPRLEAPTFAERDITPPPERPATPELETEQVLQARRNAEAEYDQAFQDLVKAEQLGASDDELMAYQKALDEAKKLRADLDAELEAVQRRIEEGRKKQSAERRRAILDEILADPQTANPAARFTAELQRQGYREIVPDADEMAQIKRFEDVRAAASLLPEDVQPVKTGDTVQAAQTVKPERTDRTRLTVDQIKTVIADGADLDGNVLRAPGAEPVALQGPLLAAAREAIRRREAGPALSPVAQAVRDALQASAGSGSAVQDSQSAGASESRAAQQDIQPSEQSSQSEALAQGEAASDASVQGGDEGAREQGEPSSLKALEQHIRDQIAKIADRWENEVGNAGMARVVRANANHPKAPTQETLDFQQRKLDEALAAKNGTATPVRDDHTLEKYLVENEREAKALREVIAQSDLQEIYALADRAIRDAAGYLNDRGFSLRATYAMPQDMRKIANEISGLAGVMSRLTKKAVAVLREYKRANPEQMQAALDEARGSINLVRAMIGQDPIAFVSQESREQDTEAARDAAIAETAELVGRTLEETRAAYDRWVAAQGVEKADEVLFSYLESAREKATATTTTEDVANEGNGQEDGQEWDSAALRAAEGMGIGRPAGPWSVQELNEDPELYQNANEYLDARASDGTILVKAIDATLADRDAKLGLTLPGIERPALPDGLMVAFLEDAQVKGDLKPSDFDPRYTLRYAGHEIEIEVVELEPGDVVLGVPPLVLHEGYDRRDGEEFAPLGAYRVPGIDGLFDFVDAVEQGYAILAQRAGQSPAGADNDAEIADQFADAADPTEGQKEAGNYQMAHVRIDGMEISIETEKGAQRSGADANGTTWSVTMPSHYGYIRGTKGADKDHVDIFIGPNPDNGTYYVINQNKPNTYGTKKRFDEHKVAVGFDSENEAVANYLLSFADDFGAKVFDSVSGPYTADEFKALIPALEKAAPIKKKTKKVKPLALATAEQEAERFGLVNWLAYVKALAQPKRADEQRARARKIADAEKRLSKLPPSQYSDRAMGEWPNDNFERFKASAEINRELVDTEIREQDSPEAAFEILNRLSGSFDALPFSREYVVHAFQKKAEAGTVRTRRIKVDDVPAVEVTLPSGNVYRMTRLTAGESMGLAGWHDMDRDQHSFLGDNQEQAIAALIEREAGQQARAAEDAAKPAEFMHNGIRIYPATVNVGGERKAMWGVESAENKAKREAGERYGFGDSLFDTQDQAMAAADRQIRDDAARAERDQLDAEIAELKQARAEARNADTVNGFTAGKSAMEAGRIKTALDKQYRFDGKDVMSVRARIESLYRAGTLEVSSFDEPKIKPMSRTQFNRATQREQDAHEKKVREAGTKTVYLVNDTDLGKIGHDYAQHLLTHGIPAAVSDVAQQQGATETVAEPKNWRTSYGAAQKYAEALGVNPRGEDGKYMKLPALVAAIDAKRGAGSADVSLTDEGKTEGGNSLADAYEREAAKMTVQQIDGSAEYVVGYERHDGGRQSFARFALSEETGRPVKIKYFYDAESSRAPAKMAIDRWAKSRLQQRGETTNVADAAPVADSGAAKFDKLIDAARDRVDLMKSNREKAKATGNEWAWDAKVVEAEATLRQYEEARAKLVGEPLSSARPQPGGVIVHESAITNDGKAEGEEKPSRKWPDEGAHFHAGASAFSDGKPRILPSYFTANSGKNAKDWYRGWDAANLEAKQPGQREPATTPPPAAKMPAPKWWQDATPAKRLWYMSASGVKNVTASTPWSRLNAADQRALDTQWGERTQVESAAAQQDQGAVIARDGDLLHDAYGENTWQVIGDVRDAGDDSAAMRVRVNLGTLSERQKSVTLREFKARVAEDREFRAKTAAARQDSSAPSGLDATATALSDKKRAAAEKLKRLLDSRKGTLNSGVDPELMLAVAELGALSIAEGAVKFAQWVRDVVRSARAVGIQDEQIKPFLKEAYGAIAANPEKYDLSEDQADAMDALKDVRKADVDALAVEENDGGIAYDGNDDAEGVSNEQDGNDRGDEGALAPVSPRELQDAEGGEQAGEGSRRLRGPDADGNGRAAEGARDEFDGGVAGEPGAVLPEGSIGDGVEQVEISGERRSLDEVAESVKNDSPASEPKPKFPARFGDNPGNYSITDADAIGTGTPGERIRANLAAVRLVLELERENRYPTREEQAVLAKYVGWGGLKNVFKGDNSSSKQEREAYAELKRRLTPDQLFWMGQSVLNAHYTSPKVVGAMYRVLRHFGIDGGRFLEPTVGSGNFIGLMPADMAAGAKWFASEIDPITSLIAKNLYPDAQILPATGFQDAEFAYGRMDVAIGNPPFGDERITDTNKKRAEINGFKIHNYVISKSAMHLRPGGIMSFVVTSRFLDTANPEAREFLAKNFKFIGAFRLPNNAFAENAGTEVTTDIIFLQRLRGEQREGVTADDMAWLDTNGRLLNDDNETVTLNRYFAENPGMLLGKPSMQGTMYGSRTEKGEFTLQPIPGMDFAAEIDRILENEWAPLKGIGKARTADADEAAAAVMLNREDVPVGGYFRDGDRIVQRVDDDADGNVQFRELTPETPWTEKQTLGATRLARIKGMLALREMAYDLMADERADAPTDRLNAKRAELNRVYDKFVDEFGFLNDAANKSLMDDDPRIEFGLEGDYTKAITAAAAKRLGQKPAPSSAKKSSLLTERVFYPKQEIDRADSPADGYAISLSEKGRLDLEYIAEITDMSVEQVIADLSSGDKPLIFKDPAMNRWVQEDEYLSGNVKEKLKVARGAGLEANVRALEAVQPKDVPIQDIHAEFGATWIPAGVYEDFLRLLGYDAPRVAVMPRSGAVDAVQEGRLGASSFRADIENEDYSIAEVFSAAANRRQLIAYDGRGENRVVNQQRTENLGRIRNKMIAIWNDWIKSDPDRGALIEQQYNALMNTTVERRYDGVTHLRTVGANPAISLRNSQKNSAWRMIQSSITLLDHVVGAGKTIALITGIMERRRLGLSKKPIVVVPNHLVGQWARDWIQLYPGANILAATEKDFQKANRRRLFARIATGKFDAVIVGHSSFGFIPVSREAELEFIRGEVQHLEAALTEAEAAEGGKKGKGDSRRVRAIKNRIAKRMEKIRELQDKPRDNVVTFEDMGIDYLAVDELHEFKNLEYATTLSNVAGMGSPEGAKKSFDLYMKMRLLQEAGGGIAGATGTPISNSMVEMYSLLRYLNPESLAARGMEQFDAWVKAFASIEPRDEYTAAGKIKQRTVLAAFNNLPELLQIYKQVADTVTMTDLKRIYAEQVRLENEGVLPSKRKSEAFPVPKVAGGGRRLDIGEPTEEQVEFMDYLIARADILEKLKGKQRQEYAKTDNALWLMNDARKMSLDVRIINPSLPDNPNNKVNRAAKNIRAIYDKWDADLGTQLVFCDLSTPAKNAAKDASAFIKGALKVLGLDTDRSITSALESRSWAGKWAFLEARAEQMIESGSLSDSRRESIETFLDKVSDDDRSALDVADSGFSVYDALKAKLIESGIPEREIAFIHDANTADQKRELFDLVKAGKVRVLIGSSAKMGAGTNVQDKIVALHHLDAPWRPSDIEQREGRAIRQGNRIAFDKDGNPIRKDFELEIIAYSTERTFDAQMWGVLARKAAFLEQFRMGLRSIKEEGGDAASYAEFMAEATGDQIFREKLNLERELVEIEAEDRSSKMKRTGAERLVERAESSVSEMKAEIESSRKRAAADFSSVTFEGATYRNDTAAVIEAEMALYREEFAAYEELEQAYKVARKAWEDAAGTERGRAPAKPKAPEIPELIADRVVEKSEWAKLIDILTKRLAMIQGRRASDSYTLTTADGQQIVLDASSAEGADYVTVSLYGNTLTWGAARGPGVASKLMPNRISGELKDAAQSRERALERLQANIAQARVTLDHVKPVDPKRIEDLRARYEAVKQQVDQISERMALERAQRDNRFISRDKKRFPTGKASVTPAAESGVQQAPVAERARFRLLNGRAVAVRGVEDVSFNGLGDYTFFAIEDGDASDPTWFVIEDSTGLSVGKGETRDAAIKAFNSTIKQRGLENVREVIQKADKLTGDQRRDALKAAGDAEGPSALRASPAGGGVDFEPVSLDVAASVIAGVRPTAEEVWNVELRLVPTFDALPQGAKDKIARDYGPDERPKGFLMGDQVYVIADEHESASDVEATILHEIKGHVGVRRFYGTNITRELNKLFLQIGGAAGMQKIAKERGIALGGYAQALSNSRHSDDVRVQVMMEELLAHMAEAPSLKDRVKAIVGMLRDLLRRAGFPRLAEYGETDLLHILKKADRKLSKPDPDGGPRGGRAPTVLRKGEDARAKITESEAFRKWFGNSKVVDAEGRPLVVYHGTGEDFTSFSTGNRGSFFTDDSAIAEGYGKPVAAYLSLKNPVVIDAKGAFWNELDTVKSAALDELRQHGKIAITDHIKAAAEKAGYDGAIVLNVVDNDGAGNQYIAFRPEQIKSATGNAGTFDPTNPSILASRKAPPINNANRRTALFTALARFDDAFQQPTPTGKTVEAIAREIDAGYRVKAMPDSLAKEKSRGRAVKAWEITVPKSDHRAGFLYEDARGRVWLDVSRLQPGIDAGNKIYGIAAGYAHNAGKVLIGDPEGLSPTALFRRLENMISSALRYGTTDHLYPHGAQIEPRAYFADEYPEFAAQLGGLGLDWKDGDFAHNLTEMMRVSYNAATRFAPKIKEIIYDFDSRQFVDASTGDRRSRDDLRNLYAGRGAGAETRYRGGGATLARAAIFNTLVRGQGTEAWRGVLAAVSDQLRGRGLDFELNGLFYRREAGGEAASGMSPEQFRSALVERFGENGVATLERTGLLNIGTSDTAGVAAWYDAAEGRAYFDPSRMSSATEAIEAVLHEIGEHHGLRDMLGERGWATLRERMADLAADGDNEVAAAWSGVVATYPEFQRYAKDLPAAIESDRFVHEVLAKLGESAAGRKSSVWRDLLAAINRFLLKMGIGRQVNKAEIADLVEGSLKRQMRGKGVKRSLWRPSGEPVMARRPERVTAAWTPDRITRLLREFAYSMDATRTKAYAAWISPDDFLNATTPSSDRDQLESERRPLDAQGLADETQPIFLEVQATEDDEGTFRIVGHEGRHRMMALRDAGVRSVPVVLRLRDAKYDAQEIDEPFFMAQRYADKTRGEKPFYARRAYPISYANELKLRDDFGSEAGVMFQRPFELSDYLSTTSAKSKIRDRVAGLFDSAKTFNWWQRTVGSQYGKARADADFRRVYEKAHAFIDDVSKFARNASDKAQGILPHMDTFGDVVEGLNVRKAWSDAKDYQEIADAIFTGTLEDKVWNAGELRARFNLDDKQIGLYRQFRDATNQSLETLAASEMARAARAEGMELADTQMSLDEAEAFYVGQVQPLVDAAVEIVDGLRMKHRLELEDAADLSQAKRDALIARQAGERMRAEGALAKVTALRDSFTAKKDEIRKLQDKGYAPLMRFGQYTVDVVRLDENGKPAKNDDGEIDRPFFGMFESEAEAREAEKVMREEYPGYTVSRGIASTESSQLYQGMSPEAAEMFARLLGVDVNDAFQTYLRQALNNRSAMKRLIQRKGMAGFANDVPRVLASFIASNARLASSNWHFGEMRRAAEAIPKHKGDVKDEAIRLMNYIQNPQEEAAAMRGFLFFNFLGGSLAAALVNTTQTISTTLPYLNQFGAAKAAKSITGAMGLAARAMKSGLDVVKDRDLRDALKAAADDGIIDPQEIHLLMAEARGSGASNVLGTVAGLVNESWRTPAARIGRAAAGAWGSFFSLAEKYNRHVAFIAAWEVAKDMTAADFARVGVKDRFEFARQAVIETQFDYTKASRPNWARGAIGATLFTFKTFIVNYIEFLSRLPSRERAVALAALFVLSGLSGAPGMDDLDDLIDTVGQKLGYNWNNEGGRHAWLVDVLGKNGANFVEHGVSAFIPLDVSARLGMGNLIPGTGLFKESTTSPGREVTEIFGPAGSVFMGVVDTVGNVGSGKDLSETLRPVLPKAINDFNQALDIAVTGEYRDYRGRKVVDADLGDAFIKAIGFHPNVVAEPKRVERMVQQSVGLHRTRRAEINELWARGIVEGDDAKVREARDMLRDWNRKNPTSPIRMNPESIKSRVRAMRSTSAERLIKASSKDMRGMVSNELAVRD